jgi:hypothetical protein
MHTIHDEFSDEGDVASGGRESFGLPDPRACNVVNPIAPITTTPLLENALTLLAIPMVPLWTATQQLGIGLLLEQQQAYQEKQQARARAQ